MFKIKFICALSFFFMCMQPAFAQYFQHVEYPVSINGQPIQYGFAGGLNNPQFSEADWNNDGVKDLYIFDKTGNVHLSFIKTGGTYTFSPGYSAFIPTLRDWALMRDFNEDGAMDLFSNSNYLEGLTVGVVVFTGRFENNFLKFDRMNFNKVPNFNILPIEIDTNSNSYTNIPISFEDIPALDDIDGDGDMDILTFNTANSQTVDLYRNYSLEDGFGKDSLLFKAVELCWGKFLESGMSADLILSDDSTMCAEELVDPTVDYRHAGSTLMTFDQDNDGVKELVLGDLFYEKLSYLKNSGSPYNAWITETDISFPSYDTPVDIPLFNAGFYLDVDNDQVKDMVVAPNSIGLVEDTKGVWFYKGNGNPDNVQFTYQQNDFIVGEMLDFGTGAKPTFADVNGDGLQDIVVGNFSLFQPFGDQDARLFLILNTGTQNAPSFNLVDENWLDFQSLNPSGLYDFAPTFGDLDSDGDQDLLVGARNGKLIYLENLAGAGNPMSFGPKQLEYAGIDVGQTATPQIVDLNRDSLPDIVIGERNGELTLFINTGTPSAPAFESDEDLFPNIDSLGKIDTESPDSPTRGYSAPHFIDFDGTFQLFTGTFRGSIQSYSGIDNNLDGAFNLDNPFWGEIREGEQTSVDLHDLNNDGILEAVVGNYRGGIGLFQTNLNLDGTTALNERPRVKQDWELYPNPAQNTVHIVLAEGMVNQVMEGQLWNASGQLIRRFDPEAQNTISLEDLPNGFYVVSLILANGQTLGKKLHILRP